MASWLLRLCIVGWAPRSWPFDEGLFGVPFSRGFFGCRRARLAGVSVMRRCAGLSGTRERLFALITLAPFFSRFFARGLLAFAGRALLLVTRLALVIAGRARLIVSRRALILAPTAMLVARRAPEIFARRGRFRFADRAPFIGVAGF